MRPASNAIACISDKTRLTTAGVCTASAGNFAQVRERNTPVFLDTILGLGLVLQRVGGFLHGGHTRHSSRD